ncbi:MAG: transketolase family protein [Candidatus Omnitrophica bacterium]|nr:transketolase family protein [Candidatus Omnitrophota bacterium]
MEKKLGLATRDAYGKALVEIGKSNPDVVVLDADLSKSTKTEAFGKEFPSRFFNCGIAEANMVGIAAGLASQGKIPFLSSFACFLVNKGFEQFRMAVAFPELNVKVVTSHGGISVGEDGASQQSIEDVALMATLPGFKVIVPSDEYCTRAIVMESVGIKDPVYIRTGRPKAPIVHSPRTVFKIGKGVLIREGKDVAIFANGLLVWEALQAAETLASQGVSACVVDAHTVKPLDEELIVSLAAKTRAVVTAEEHQSWGGLGSAVSRLLSERRPVPVSCVAIQDTYAESGKPDELIEKYGLTSAHIVKAAQQVIRRKIAGAEKHSCAS